VSENVPKRRWWPKPLLKEYFSWREPKAYLLLKEKYERPAARRIQPLLFLFIVGLILLRWWIDKKRHVPRESFWGFLPLTLVVAALIAYGVPWIVSKCPSYVKVRNKRIMRMRGNNSWSMEFNKAESFRWIPMQQWWILRLTSKSGGHFCLCAPPDISRAALDSFLLERSLRKEPDGHYTDFPDLVFLRDAV
jgi:hypothetical protein